MHIIALSPFITLIHNRGQSYLSLISRNNCIPFAALSKKAWWPLCVAVRSYTCRYANEFVCFICQTHTQSLTWVCPKLQASKVRSLNSINPIGKKGVGWGYDCSHSFLYGMHFQKLVPLKEGCVGYLSDCYVYITVLVNDL